MKLIRLKVNDANGFRSLQSGFEYHFRTDWSLQDEFLEQPQFTEKSLAPFVCAGPNGSGKSNLLEALAVIFFQLEILRVRRDFLPSAFDNEDVTTGKEDSSKDTLNAYELDYLIKVPKYLESQVSPLFAEVRIRKTVEGSLLIIWQNYADFELDEQDLKRLSNQNGLVGDKERDFLLPDYVLGYSSGENEILSLPFFKMRFIQFDEYWNSLKELLPYSGRPETRLAYIDSSFSQAILLCNLLYDQDETLQLFEQDMGLGDLQEFRIIIKRSISLSIEQVEAFGSDHPALIEDEGSNQFKLNIMDLLEADQDSAKRSDPIINRLKRCATCYFLDEATDTLYLDYCVNEATKKAFSENFSFEVNKSPIELFQAFQVLLTLNLYSVSDALKSDLYQSNSHYVGETIPVLASDERIMRFKFFRFKKQGINEPVMLKNLSDGEHQLIHSLGLCLLFKNTNSLFLLDEPETHFNPEWRSNFISRLRACFPEQDNQHSTHEMLITTHTPFLISDSERSKVLIFNKDPVTHEVSIEHPDYNTLGASINKITMETFNKSETIGAYANSLLAQFREEFKSDGVDIDDLLKRLDQRLGDSVEKLLLMKSIVQQTKGKG